MIVYLDTSAIIKHYLQEPGSENVQRLFQEADYLGTSVFSEIETISSLERAKKIARIDSPSYRSILAQMNRDFQTFALEAVSAETVRNGIRLVRQHGLRPGDAIQLASAQLLKRRLPQMIFAAYDEKLLESARLEELKTA